MPGTAASARCSAAPHTRCCARAPARFSSSHSPPPRNVDERAAPERLRLTSLIGRPVGSSAGHRVGWARDLVVDLGGAPPGGVTGVVVGDFNERWLLPWPELTLTGSPEPCWLATGAGPARMPL